jgi:broad specificity phosphatase PhoE
MNVEGIFVCRHAPVAQNDPKNERLRGQTDPPVLKEGREVADERAQFFNGLPIRRVFMDGLTRCLVQAQAIKKVTGAAVIKDKGPIAWNMGSLQGMPEEAGERKLDRYMFLRPDEQIPDGESFSTFKDRWLRFLQTHRHDSGSVAVTHLRNLIVAAGWAEAGAVGTRVNLKSLRNYEPFKKIEIALITPKGEFVILKMKAKESEMVHA